MMESDESGIIKMENREVSVPGELLNYPAMQLSVNNSAKTYEGDNIQIVHRQERDRQIVLFYRNIDCRYFETFKRLKSKFKRTYACSQEQCPIIRERMMQHMTERHCSTKKARIAGVIDSYTPSDFSSSGLSDMNAQYPTKSVASTQTLLGPVDTYKDNYPNKYHNTDYFSDKAVSYSGVSVRLLDTNVEDTLKTELKDELVNIFENIPLNPKNREAMLTTLADDISKIVVRDDLDTDDKIKAEIDIAVNKLLMNYPASKLDKYKLVGDVRARLFDVVKDKRQDVVKNGDKNIDTVSTYSNICNMYDENGFPKASYDLTDPIKKLFENYPIHKGTKLSKEEKDNLLNNLIDDINEIARNTTMADADKKSQLEKLLDHLHSKYPEPMDSQEHEKYKNEIRDELFNLIKGKPKDLTDSVKKLFENYPIHTETKLSKKAKDKLLNNLIDEINQISRNKTMADINKKVEIEQLLDDFHTKYPEQSNDKEKQNQLNEIREKLFDLILTKPKESKKKWEVPNDTTDFSGPSGAGGRARTSGSSGKNGGNKNSGFVTDSRGFGSGTTRKSFGSPNSKMVGISSGGGMSNTMAGNRKTNRLYGGGTDNNGSEAGSSRPRGVNGGSIGNGIAPNDGVFSGYSGGLDNRPRTSANDNSTPNNNLSHEATHFFENHPIFNQSPHDKDLKENTIRHLVDDVNKLAANNKLNDGEIENEVDKLVEKLEVKYKNEIREKLCDLINKARNNIGNRRNSKKDKSNESGPSKKRPGSAEYDFKKSLYKALNDVAIYPQKKDEHRDSVVNNLFDDINWIAESIQPDNDEELNSEIERALDRLHLWYPGAKRDQIEYRNDIKNRLFNVIKEYHRNKPVNPPKDDYHKNKRVSRTKDDTEERILSVSSYDSDSYNTGQDAKSIKHWVNQLKHEKFMKGVDADELVKKLINRLVPILQSDSCCGKTTILKGAVLEIFSEIPATTTCNNKLQRMVSDLVNNLYCRHKNDCCSSAGSRRQTLYVDTYKNDWKSNKLNKLNEFLDGNNIARNHDVRNEIADLIMAVYEEPGNSVVECDLENSIKKILEKKTINATASEVINTYKNITKFLNDDDENNDGTFLNCPLTKNLSIYTSDTSCCATSTPKKTANKEVNKLNEEEIKYIDDLSSVIRAWMKTLPVQFNSPEEKSFKEAVVSELAGEIMDIAKIAQITPHTKEVTDDDHKRLVYKWLYKLNVFDKDKMGPYVDDFLKRLKNIPVPVLTRPHQGTRQAMDNIKVREEQGWVKDFLPKGIDVLEDEISIWVNEQPSDMFKFRRGSRNNKIHNLAEAIQTKLKNKSSESEIKHDIEKWLKDNIRMDKCENMDEVKDSLKDRVIKLPGDATIAANYEEKQKKRAASVDSIETQENEPKKARTDEDTMDNERTMKDFIVKFVDHHYDVDDPLAIKTFNYLLKSKLQRINPPVKNEDICPCSNEALSPQKLYEELELVKTVSDWLKNIPVDEGYHTVGNKERIDLVLGLTRNIKAIEDEREETPCAMDYDLYLAETIHTYFCNIPFIKGYDTGENCATMLKQLMHRVAVWRELIANKRINKSLDTSGINDENIGDFIEEFIRHHGTEIANDEVKMEAWSIRLLREIKKILRNSPDPKIVTKSQVYNKLVSVPIPGDDTVDRFDRELVYIEEITCWMKNLALLPIDEEDEKGREEEEENRRIMICDLAETMAQKENLANDVEFKEYLTKWIQDLPLDQTHEINIPLLINQLINRIERTTKGNDAVAATDSKVSKTGGKSKNRLKRPSTQDNHLKSPSKQDKNPGTIAIDAIEKWSKSLPFKSDEAAKGKIERKLYQKVGEFNSDPIVFHDDLLYQTLLTVEVDEVLEKLPDGDKLQKSMEQKNKELVKSLVDARRIAKEKGAGDDYKHRLERTLDASIPSPVTPKQVFDPAFEIYKSRLADMFILDNFDHGNDEVKLKYERRIKDEIDKYFDGAGRRNATRLTKHEIYNELYSALFKVPIPNEKSVMEEVEQIKTRCVIDAWVEKLPLIHNDNLLEQLEFDKKVATLAKRIHEIEKLPKSDEKVKKKILKWLSNVPIQQGKEVDIEEYTDILIKELKASKCQRKCVIDKKGKSKAKIKQKKTEHNESQIPGPSSLDVRLQPSTKSQPKKAADLIVDIVEQWSNTIPLSSHGKIDAETMRNDVVRKVLIKISDVNTNPDIFDHDYIYKVILDEELEKILNEIPKCCDFEPNDKAQIKSTLIEAVTALKPLIRKEKLRINYKHDLNRTLNRMLEIPHNIPCSKLSEFEAVKEDIIENFVQIHYDKDDDEGRQKYKENVNDAVVKFLTKIAGEKDHNPQMRTNQLLSELAKVPVPNNETLKEEVEEIRMKNDITEFFDVNNIKKPKDKSTDVIKTNLAKKLCNIEKGGHNRENDDKMKNEITRTLKKLNKELKPQTIEGFVNKLKANESTRKKKVTKDDTVCDKNCRMLKSMANIEKNPCNEICPHMPEKPKPCSDATCPYQTTKDDTARDTSNYNTKIKKIEICTDTCPNKSNKPEPCSDATCPNQTLKDDTAKDANKYKTKTKNIDETCTDTCPKKSNKPKSCSDATCPNQTLKDDTAKDVNKYKIKTKNIDETCTDTCPNKSKKPKPCSDATCPHQALKDDTAKDVNKYKIKTKNIDETCTDTCPNKSKKPKPCSDATCPNQTLKDDTAKDANKYKIKTNNIDETCTDTCPNKCKIPKSCSDATCPHQKLKDDPTKDASKENTEKTDKICKESCPRCIYNKKFQTDPLDSKKTQTGNTDNNEDYEITNSQDSDSSNNDSDYLQEEEDEEIDEEEDENAQRRQKGEICPCQKQMREMWQRYMAAVRWRCEGAEDPFCREGQHMMMAPPRREMGPMGPMMGPMGHMMGPMGPKAPMMAPQRRT